MLNGKVLEKILKKYLVQVEIEKKARCMSADLTRVATSAMKKKLITCQNLFLIVNIKNIVVFLALYTSSLRYMQFLYAFSSCF